jgi:hypothetical protein
MDVGADSINLWGEDELRFFKRFYDLIYELQKNKHSYGVYKLIGLI